MNSKSIKLVPEGEVKCVWMSAGLVSYKLCDRNLDCKNCSFDLIMKGETAREEKASVCLSPAKSHNQLINESGSLKENALHPDKMLQNLLNITVTKEKFYHMSHIWIELISSEKIKLGLDKFAGLLLGKIKAVLIPSAGVSIRQNSVFAWIVTEFGVIPIKSPVSGEIITINLSIQRDPSLIQNDPEGAGWLIELRPANLDDEFKCLISPDRFRLINREDAFIFSNLIELVLRRERDKVGITLADGGVEINNIGEMIGTRKYFEIISAFFF
jgi:glycine cleavage system H protein